MRLIPILSVVFAVPSFTCAQQTRSLLDAPVVAIDGWSRFDELLDLDLDGDLDGVGLYVNRVSQSGQPAFMELKLHRNDGTGRFTSSILRSWPTTPGTPTLYRSAVGDVDGDGHDDVVTLIGGQLSIVESRSGQPSLRSLSVPNGAPFSLATAARLFDLDGDGRAELITVDTYNGLRVFGLGPVLVQQRAVAAGASSTELALLEANGDGQMDAAVVEGGALRIYPITATGYIAPFLTLPLPAGLSNYFDQGHIVAGDVDNDMDTDLVVFGSAGQYAFVERQGPSQFVVHAAQAGGPATYLYDYDGDGDLDGCCCGGGTGPSTTSPNTAISNFEIAENLGGGVFAPAWRMPSVGSFHLAGCADVDGDGHVDLVGGRCVYFGRGRHDPLTPVLSTRPLSWPVDVDRDGDPDVIDSAAGQFTNRGNGVMAATTIVLPSLPTGEAWQLRQGMFDCDRDGDMDLIAHRLVGGVPTDSHLLRNAGGGYFADAGLVTPGGGLVGGADALLACDLDGDGDVDFVAVDGAVMSQLWRQVGGAFVAAASWSNERVLAAADFTGDGRDDLLLAAYPYLPNLAYMQLTLLASLGGGSFQSRPIDIRQALEQPGIVDYEGDGDLDLILANYNGDSVLEVWRNDGLGQFAVGPTMPGVSMGYGARIDVADVDGDGRWDLVAGPAGYYDMAVNSGAGVWVIRQIAPLQFVEVLYSTEPGWPVDLDGDGDLDLLGKAFVGNVLHDGASGGAREQFGSGVAGTGGASPTLGAVGPFRTGAIVSTTLTGGVGQSIGVVLGSLAQAVPATAPIPGFTLHLDGPIVLGAIVLAGSLGAAGEGGGTLPLLLPPSAAGLTFYQQALVFDAAGIAPGITHTGALRIQIGW